MTWRQWLQEDMTISRYLYALLVANLWLSFFIQVMVWLT